MEQQKGSPQTDASQKNARNDFAQRSAQQKDNAVNPNSPKTKVQDPPKMDQNRDPKKEVGDGSNPRDQKI